MTRRLFLYLLTAATLSGCGFTLRDGVGLPASLDRIAVDGSDLEMVVRLERALKANGVTVADTGDRTAAVLHLLRSEFRRDVRTADADGLATSYTLLYHVVYEVRTASGDALQVDQRLRLQRMLDHDPLQQLQSEAEETLLRAEMREEIVLQILHRLGRIRPG